jgi:hypothetical protein
MSRSEFGQIVLNEFRTGRVDEWWLCYVLDRAIKFGKEREPEAWLDALDMSDLLAVKREN